MIRRIALVAALLTATLAHAADAPIILLPTGYTYTVRYLAAGETDKVCFYRWVNGAVAGDALGCHTPAATCAVAELSLENCAADQVNVANVTLTGARADFELVAIAFRVEAGEELPSAPSAERALALVVPGAPVLVK